LLRDRPDNPNDSDTADRKECSVWRYLLANLGRFFDMLETARRSSASDWLTVDEVAKELKMSKSNVYRLIHAGNLEAVDLVVGDDDNKIPKKGHRRVRGGCQLWPS